MQKKYVVFFPYSGSNVYIENMKRCWGGIYRVISLEKAERTLLTLLRTKAIVLNWIESALDFEMKKKLILYKLLGIKIIWVFHNRIPHNICNDKRAVVLAKRNMFFMAFISDAVILHSQNSRIYLREYLKKQDKVFYVPHVDYIRQYKWVADNMGGEKNYDFRFVFQGNISPYKNIELLIKVFKELELPNCQLCIVGRPYNEEFARKLKKISEDVNIEMKLEYLTDDAIGEEIRRGDVVVLPYDVRSSMNSGAMLAAFSNKRTVIISNNAMAQDYKDKSFLYVYNYKSQKDHFEKLKMVMRKAYENGKTVNKEKGIMAYEYTQTHNSDIVVIQKLKELLERI